MFREVHMDPIPGINANTSIYSIGSSAPIIPGFALLKAEQSLSTSELFGDDFTQFNFSTVGQLMSAVATFMDEMRALQPGSVTSGGGQNYGTDFASLAAEVQHFVDTFNTLQNSIANLNGPSVFGFTGTLAGSAALVQSLDTQAQATFSNGSSALTTLAQLGITFQPTLLANGGGTLSVDMNKLQAAFNSDASGAFALLGKAANAFGDLASSFVVGSNGMSPFLGMLLNASFDNDDFFSGNSSVAALLASGALAGSSNLTQVLSAMTEYRMVSGLFA
jgi:hypothetical protein